MDPNTDRRTEELRVDEICQEIESTRSRVAETIDALRNKADFPARLGEVLAAVAEGTAAHVAQRLASPSRPGVDDGGSRRSNTIE